jgi:putative component of membrane protein insertase Oxa1/YidC/SpoIIIJ protein YidD
MGAWRIMRCNPWSNGGVDFVKGVPTNTQKTHERAPVLNL